MPATSIRSGSGPTRVISFWLSLILVFMIPFQEMIDIGRPVTAIRAMTLLVTAFWVISVIEAGKIRKPHLFHIAFFFYVLWNALSAFWSFDIEKSTERILIYFQLASLIWILWEMYTLPANLKAGLQAYVLGGFLPIGSTVVNYIKGNALPSLQYTATGYDTNDVGLILALGIPVAWHLAASTSNNGKAYLLRLVDIVYIPAAIFVILLTASRGAFLAIVPAILFVLWSLRRLKRLPRIMLLVALVGALLVLQPHVPQSSVRRLGTIGDSIAEFDIGDRVSVWREGIAVFADHPILGVGSGAFPVVVERNTVAHNSFLSVLVEVGLVGFALFACILAIVVYQVLKQPKWDSRFWLSILLVWAIGSSALSWERANASWLFLSLAIGSSSLSIRSNAAALQSEPLAKRI